MATTNLGPVGLVPKGAYNSSTAYKRLNIVSYTDGNAYVAIADSTGIPPTNTTKWKKLIDNEVNLSPKADKVNGATDNHFAALDDTGNLKDSGKKAGDFATAAQGTKADNLQTEVANARKTYATLKDRLDAQDSS